MSSAEVQPGPAALTIDFAGEEYVVGLDEHFVVGRGGNLDIDDNPYLHRRFLEFRYREGFWWVANVGNHLSATLTDTQHLVQAVLAPGASLPVVFSEMIVTFSAGSTTYELLLSHAPELGFDPHPATPSGGDTTLGRPVAMTRSQLQLILALCEPTLSRRGSGRSTIPSNAEAAARLGWAQTRFNRKLDNVCEKLGRVGVTGLRGDAGALATHRRARLVEYAVASRLVTVEMIRLLDEPAPESGDR